MKKKILAAFLLACALALSVAQTAWAADKLPAPTELSWGKSNGTIYWSKNGAHTKTCLVKVFYSGLEGKDEPEFKGWISDITSWETDNGSYDYIYIESSERLKSGHYFFTVQSISMDKTTQNSDIVKSEDYIYTKPSEKLNFTFSDIAWRITDNAAEPAATWQTVDYDSRFSEYEVDILYAANANDTPEYAGGLVGVGNGSYILDDYDKANGPGYYYFHVRALGDNINYLSSDWSDLSDGIYITQEQIDQISKRPQLIPNQEKLDLSLNETAKLTLDIIDLPEEYAESKQKYLDNMVFVCIDPDIAEVDNYGNVTPKKAGETVIEVFGFTPENSNYEEYPFGLWANCKVTVTDDANPPAAVAVTGVTLNETALNLQVNGTATLQATVAPENATNKSVRWSSNNTSVATVDNTGKVTAAAPGTAAITVTTEDGNKTATCAVTVVEKQIPVTAITLDKTELTLEVTGTAQLKATVEPTDTTSTISWTSSDEKVATVDSTGKVTPLTKGTATIIAAADGVKATCTVTVTADTVYTITFDTDGGTLAEGVTNPDYVTKGKEYKMPTATKSGYTLTAWAIGAQDSENKVKANDVYTFTDDTTVYAIWQYNGGGGSSGGSSSRPGTSGGTTTSGTTAGTTTGSTTTTGTTTSGSNTVTAANINNVFADVQNNAWYSEAIAYVYNNGIMNGTENGFEPNATTTRAMLVTMLFRLEGEPAAGNPAFADVASGQWFSDAIAWASANGVVNGYENGLFGPNDSITREQLAVILYRFAQLKGYAVSANGSLSSFSDSGSVSGWAQEAMQWAVGAGIINGDNGALKPAGNATRAEVATMLMRFSENIAK